MTRTTKLRWILAAAVVVALVVAGRSLAFEEWFAAFGSWISGLGPAGYALYIAAYVAVSVLMMPAVLLTVGAGFLFGFVPGTAVALTGATLGASAAFLIARYSPGTASPGPRRAIPAFPPSTAPSPRKGGASCCCSGCRPSCPSYYRITSTG